MKIKGTVTFKDLRSKGPKSIDVKGDEVVQLLSRGKTVKYIVDAQHYLDLHSIKDKLLVDSGLKKEEIVSLDRMNLNKRFNEISNFVAQSSLDSQVYGCSSNSINLKDDLKLDDLLGEKEVLSSIKLVEEKILSYYDMPQIFIAKDPNTNILYLVFYKDSSEKDNCSKDNFFVVRTSENKIDELENDKMDLYSWIKSHYLLIDYSIIYEKNKLPQETFKQTSFTNLKKEGFIPDKGIYLGQDPNKKIEDSIEYIEKYLKEQLDNTQDNKKSNSKDLSISNVYDKFLFLKEELKKGGK